MRAGVFQNSAYAESWQKVADAKKLTKRYDAELAEVQAKLARGKLTVESEEYKSAVANAKAANGRLEAAKQDHENIRKIYAKDARREDAYNYYHDMQFDSSSGRSKEEILKNIEEMKKANKEKILLLLLKKKEEKKNKEEKMLDHHIIICMKVNWHHIVHLLKENILMVMM